MSEPIFEASVRLQADVSDFETQAQQSVKRVLDSIEQQTQQAIRNSQQRVTQAAQLAQQQATQTIVQPRVTPAPPPPPVAPVQQLAQAGTGPPAQIDSVLAPPENVATVQSELEATLAASPTPIPTEVQAPTETPTVTLDPAIQPVVVEQPVVPPAPTGDPVIYPSEVEQPQPVEVPPQPPIVIPVEAELANIGAEIDSASQQLDALRQSGAAAKTELAAVASRIQEIGEIRTEIPERAFQTLPEAGELANLEKRAEELRKQIGLERQLADATRDRLNEARETAADFRAPAPQAPPQLSQALEQARALAAQPVDFTIESNSEQFVQETSAAFARARQLAQENADATARIAEEAAERAAEATDVADAAEGFDERAAANAEAQLAAAVKRQADLAKAAADKFVTQVEAGAAEAVVRPSQELNQLSELAASQAEVAGLLGDEAGRAAKELESVVLASLGAAESLEFQATNLLAEAQATEGVAGDILETKANKFILEAEKLRAEAARLEREGLQQADDAAAPDQRRRGGILDALRSEASGRSTGLGGLIGGAARFGIAGFAATAAFQTFGEIQRALRVTGDEAFTTEGKIRNLGAELISGNLIGGIRAVLAQEPAKLTEGLQQAVDQIKELDDLTISTSQVLNLQRQQAQQLVTERQQATGGSAFETFLQQQADQGLISQEKATAATHKFTIETEGASDALKAYLEEQVDAGAINKEAADQIARAAVELDRQSEAAVKAATVWKQYAEAVTVGREAQDQFGLRGPGAIPVTFQAGQGPVGQVVGQQTTGIPRPIITNPFENQVFEGTGGDEVANRIRASLNQRIRSEEERLQADLKSARIIERQARTTFENAKKAADGSGAAADEYEKLVAATTGLANAAQAVKDQAARAAEEIQAAEDRIANAQIAAIRDPAAQLQAQLAQDQATQAREANELEKARADFKKKTIDANELRQAEAEYAEAVSATKITQNQIADAQEAATEAARDSRLSAEQQSLENEIAKAALTKRLSDDKAAFAAAIAYWKNLASEAGTAEEREAAQAKVIDLRQRRTAALKPNAESGADLELLRIQNRIAAAGLTDRTEDDKRFTRQLIAYWREKVISLKGEAEEQERARSQLIAARLALKRLQDQQGESPEVFAQSLFQRAVDEFRQFGSNISSSPNGLLAPQDVRGFFAGALGGELGGVGSTVERFAQAQLSETQTTNQLLRGIAENTSISAVNSTIPRPKAPLAPEEGRVTVEIGSGALRGQ